MATWLGPNMPLGYSAICKYKVHRSPETKEASSLQLSDRLGTKHSSAPGSFTSSCAAGQSCWQHSRAVPAGSPSAAAAAGAGTKASAGRRRAMAPTTIHRICAAPS